MPSGTKICFEFDNIVSLNMWFQCVVPKITFFVYNCVQNIGNVDETTCARNSDSINKLSCVFNVRLTFSSKIPYCAHYSYIAAYLALIVYFV